MGQSNYQMHLLRKYVNANREWGWQYVFPATKLAQDPRGSEIRRHHIHEIIMQKAVRAAVRKAGITKRVTLSHLPPLLRHPSA